MASPPVVEDSDIAARRAKTRIGVAVVLLAIAIGGLALLSRHKPEKTAEEPSPVEKQESISSGSEAPAQISSAQQEAAPPPPAPETPTEAAPEPPPPPPPAPIVSKLPPEPVHSTAPVTPRSVTPAEKPEKPAPLAPQPTKQEPAPAKQAQQQPAPEKAPPAKAEPKSYEVQVGVFSDMENAKQLQAKLAEHGIPSHTETKLQVGPFASKAEADAAQSKLKALGMGAVIVPGK